MVLAHATELNRGSSLGFEREGSRRRTYGAWQQERRAAFGKHDALDCSPCDRLAELTDIGDEGVSWGVGRM
jgi:hypothetical protein